MIENQEKLGNQNFAPLDYIVSLGYWWCQVPNELNPTDDGSRGVSATFFTTQHLWLAYYKD